jgi:hypothetical protein
MTIPAHNSRFILTRSKGLLSIRLTAAIGPQRRTNAIPPIYPSKSNAGYTLTDSAYNEIANCRQPCDSAMLHCSPHESPLLRKKPIRHDFL